jgi:hypothetical protein
MAPLGNLHCRHRLRDSVPYFVPSRSKRNMQQAIPVALSIGCARIELYQTTRHNPVRSAFGSATVRCLYRRPQAAEARAGRLVLEGKAVSSPTNSSLIHQPAPSASAIPRADPPASIPSQATLPFTLRPIGSRLEGLRRELISCGQELQATAPFQGRSFFDDTLVLLVRLICRIAVIGQVKAGKSSFINAFVGKPGLLPTDINPWTTAVTYLNFGCADAPANVAAEFTFFDPNEWQRLAHGGGRIRELTQRLVPGFEVELLQKHLDAMRLRSEERLGSALDNLLGKKHAFPELSTEILERYVCSGAPGASDGPTHQKGIYADIVKAADLYFKGNAFGVPTTIIDTPGTNDPFLVRDEITRRSLENADIYIVMLTARQALSLADVALLRILRGLHKDRIVVFINRIDELGDVLHDTALIVQQVRAGLRREFPTSEIPIVAGSAFWAKTAIAGSDAEIDHALTNMVKTYAGSLPDQASTSPLSNASSRGKELHARTLFQCSGFSALSNVLANLTFHSHAGHVLRQTCKWFAELGHVGRNATQQAITILETEERALISSQQQREAEMRTISAEVSKNEQLRAGLHGLLMDLQTRMDHVINERCGNMLETLRKQVDSFSEIECDSLRRAIDSRQRGRVWKCETIGLRRQLEEILIGSYRAAEEEISKLEAHVFPKLQQLLIRHYPRWRRPDETYSETSAAELPSLGALGQMVALDLEERWWNRWLSSSSNREEQSIALDGLIKREFYPIVDTLEHAAREHLKTRQSSALQNSTLIYMGLVEFLQEQNSAWLARTRVLNAPGAALRKDELRRNREIRIAELKRQIPTIDLLLRRLENVDRTWVEEIT